MKIKGLKVYHIGWQRVVYVPIGRGEELRLHLASRGILSRVSELATGPFVRLGLADDASPNVVQAILDEWPQ